eukprot:TRINITY_DN1840_c1_g3_i1.p1 TRINITY_DN1840_c1_g3~~TRINITY_DN1840_c1_g3_i1.p1  ORF type:complete len:278 (+),score=48.34 TRINITY_DN1840_c1_g3_i1:80-835(+)
MARRVDVQDYVPIPYYFGEPIDRDSMVSGVAAVLHSWVDSAPSAPASIFTGPCSISIPKFVAVLVELLDCFEYHDNVLLIALCYIKRLSLGLHHVSAMNVFRLLLSSVLASIKYNEDVAVNNRQFAELVDLEFEDVNALERKFLSLLQYRLCISEAEFAGMCQEVRMAAADRKRAAAQANANATTQFWWPAFPTGYPVLHNPWVPVFQPGFSKTTMPMLLPGTAQFWWPAFHPGFSTTTMPLLVPGIPQAF